MKNKQRGFTLFELGICLWFLLCLALAGGIIYTVIHFVSKFW